MAIFVLHQGKRHFSGSQYGKRIHRVHQIRDDRRITAELPEVERTPLKLGGKHVAGLDHPDDIFDRAVRHRDTGMRALEERLPDFVRACIDVDPVDVRSRSHDLAIRAIC